MDNLSFAAGDIAEWEESNERAYIGNGTLPRYTSIVEIVAVLTLEGCSMNYDLLHIILVTLPCLCAPDELLHELIQRFFVYKTLNLPASVVEVIQMKVLDALTYWSNFPTAYVDFSGALLDNAIDFCDEAMTGKSAKIEVSAHRLRKTFSNIRQDLLNIEAARTINRQRVSRMSSFKYSLIESNHSEFEKPLSSAAAVKAGNGSLTSSVSSSFSPKLQSPFVQVPWTS
jgi:hypothetical protein